MRNMNIYSMICAGKYHPVNGEDFLFQHHLDDSWFVAAVMDGCSAGKESHFASILYAKSISKSCGNLIDRKENMNASEWKVMKNTDIKEQILRQLFEDLNKIKSTLNLQVEEILCTLSLLVLNTNDRTASITLSGDGIFACNGKIDEIDQENTPDYLGYHLDKSFDNFIQNHTISMTFDHIHNIAIATDGLGKLRKNPMDHSHQLDPMDFFLNEVPPSDQPTYFQKQLNKIIETNEYIPYDDISMIRVIL